MPTVSITLTEPQERFVFSEALHPGMVAGYGAGKSQAAVARLLLRAIQYPGLSFAFVEPTFDLVRLIAWSRFEQMLNLLGMDYTLNKAESIITIHKLESRIIFRSGDNPARLVGFEVADTVVDEADTLKHANAQDVWLKMLARTRQAKPDGTPNTVAAVSTPEGFSWMYETYVRNVAPGYELIKAPTSSNPYLPDGYIASLKAIYPDNLLSAYLGGEFVNLTAGSVYPEFDRHKNATTERIRESEPLHIGVDFNVANMAAVVHVLRNGDPHAVDEVMGARDTPQMIEIIKQRYPGHAIFVYPDQSGGSRKSVNASLSDIALLKEANFRVHETSKNPAVRDRVVSMNRILEERRYRVNPDTCPQLVMSLEQQAYNKAGEPDKASGFDHIVDAAGYYVWAEFPIDKPVFVKRKTGIM